MAQIFLLLAFAFSGCTHLGTNNSEADSKLADQQKNLNQEHRRLEKVHKQKLPKVVLGPFLKSKPLSLNFKKGS